MLKIEIGGGKSPRGDGWLNVDILMSKRTGKPYAVVDDWKPEKKQETKLNEDFDDPIPF